MFPALSSQPEAKNFKRSNRHWSEQSRDIQKEIFFIDYAIQIKA